MKHFGSFENRMDICLNSSDDTISIRKFPEFDIAHLVRGRKIADAIDIIPRFFPICRHAHRIAVLSAIEEDPDVRLRLERLGRFIVLAENARELAIKLLNIDNSTIETAIDLRSVVLSALEIERALDLDNVREHDSQIDSQDIITECKNRLEAFFNKNVFGMPSGAWLHIASHADFCNWLEQCDSDVARRLREQRDFPVELPPAPEPHLMRCDEFFPVLREAMHQEDRHSAVAECLEGSETGALHYHAEEPLIRDMVRKEGWGILTRNAARLVTLAKITREFSFLLSQPVKYGHHCPWEVPVGMAVVMTARGMLVHSIKTKKGRIEDYAIISPTDWNFTPDGPVIQWLKSITPGNCAAVQRQASEIAMAFDPCSAVRVRTG